MKWQDSHDMNWISVKDNKLSEKLKEATKRIYLALNQVSYARADLRTNQNGDVYFLELNSLPSVFNNIDFYSSSDFILKNHPEGHQLFLDLIIRAAINDHQSRDK
jgi:hypothetical protein